MLTIIKIEQVFLGAASIVLTRIEIFTDQPLVVAHPSLVKAPNRSINGYEESLLAQIARQEAVAFAARPLVKPIDFELLKSPKPDFKNTGQKIKNPRNHNSPKAILMRKARDNTKIFNKNSQSKSPV